MEKSQTPNPKSQTNPKSRIANKKRQNAGVLKIDRLGIAVRDLAVSRAFFERSFGARFGPEHDVPGQDFHYAPFAMGGFTFELLAPKPGAGPSVISRFIEKRGEGIHHLTFQVRNLDAAIAALGKQGYAIAARISYPPDCLFEGMHWEEAFLHPRDASGVLLHLARKTKPRRKRPAKRVFKKHGS